MLIVLISGGVVMKLNDTKSDRCGVCRCRARSWSGFTIIPKDKRMRIMYICSIQCAKFYFTSNLQSVKVLNGDVEPAKWRSGL